MKNYFNFILKPNHFTKIPQILNNKVGLHIFSLLVIGLYFYIYFISKGSNSYIRIHDNLDGIIPHIKTIVNNGVYFNPYYEIKSIMNGAKYGELVPFYSISTFWFYLLDTYSAIILSKILMSLVAYFGMFLLLKKYQNNPNNNTIVVLVSLCFGLIPFYSIFLDIAGLPIIVYSLHNIYYKNTKYYNYLILFLFTFYSNLPLVGIFILCLLIGLILYDCIKNKKINVPLSLSLGILIIGYFISHIPSIYLMLFEHDFISMRTEMTTLKPMNHDSFLKHFFDLFTGGQTHTASFHYYFIPIVILNCFHKNYKIKLLFIFIMFSSLLYAFKMANFFDITTFKVLFKTIPLQIDRFYFLNPFVWYLLLYFSIINMINYFPKLKYIAIIFLIFSIRLNYYSAYSLKMKYDKSPTFNEYFSENIFKKVKNETKTSKVICVGFHPSIAEYNGISVLDIYSSNYSLNYKDKFYQIIKKELNKSSSIENYFKNWGSRCYSFSTDISLDYKNLNLTTNLDLESISLDYNFDMLKKMNCNYIISRYKIAKSKNFNLIKEITNKEKSQFNQIFVYEMSR